MEGTVVQSSPYRKLVGKLLIVLGIVLAILGAISFEVFSQVFRVWTPFAVLGLVTGTAFILLGLVYWLPLKIGTVLMVILLATANVGALWIYWNIMRIPKGLPLYWDMLHGFYRFVVPPWLIINAIGLAHFVLLGVL